MTAKNDFHEAFSHQDEGRVKGGSERAFGLVMAAFLGVVGSHMAWIGRPDWPWWIGAGGLLLLVSFLFPPLLRWPNRIWTRLGSVLHRVTGPLVMALIFFFVFTPLGLGMRMLRIDLLRLRLEPKSASYWITREPHSPSPESMKHQF